MTPKEQSLADLVAAFTTMASGCFELHRDGRLAPDQQNQWWILGNAAMRVVVRFDSAWTRIIAGDTPTIADLRRLTGGSSTAVEAIRVAKQIPAPNRLSVASGATATATDSVDAMIDSAIV
jgi:hypothetical protein